MIKDLTSLKWKKNLYYISDGTIFDIESRKKVTDIDCCETYLIDITKLSEKDQNAKDGSTVVATPESFVNYVPYIYLEFKSANNEVLKRYYPLQYMVVEGDKVVDNKAVQFHPNVFDNKYVNKFNQEIFDYIKNMVKGKEPLGSKNIQTVYNYLPSWILDSEEFMTEEYIDRYFAKGTHYNKAMAKKMEKDGVPTYQFVVAKLGIGDELFPISIWNKEIIFNLLKTLQAEKVVNSFNQLVKNSASQSLLKEAMENIAASIKESNIGENENVLNTLLNIVYEGGECSVIDFVPLCVSSDIDTLYELQKKIEEEKARLRSYYTLVNDEVSYNENNQPGKGLAKYYEWSDVANAPYKEDLWNTTANRAANINDARKDPETGELVLDENGNYIYDNCERCWQGAVKAPGAKFPWIVININENINSIISFKYTYPDGTIKVVKPWGNKVFGDPTTIPNRTWGVASVAAEFEDNDFLISENRNDGGESTFDIDRFEIELTPVA